MQGFHTTPLSPNLGLMENGSLVARNVPLAKCGWYEYLPSELGLNSQRKVIKVYRDPKDVFAPESLRSLEGLTVVDNHPPQFISPDNWSAFAKGHGQNIRRGSNGDNDLVMGDLVVSDPVLISKIQNNTQRELSLGYNYVLYHLKCGKPTVAHDDSEETCTCDDDDGLYGQRQILGNHIAIVTRGRAGPEVAIQDACPPAICCPACESGGCLTHAHELSNSSGGTEGKTAVDNQPIKQKERPKPMAQQDWLRKVLGLGLKAVATDGTPEEIAFAAHAVHTATDSDPGAIARNEKVDRESLETAERRHLSGNDSSKAKDKKMDLSDHPDNCKCTDCASMDGRMHKTLDGIAEFLAEHKKAKAASNESPLKAKEATGDADGASGEDPNEMKEWKSGVDAHMSEMRDKMATLHDGLSELLKMKEGPEEKKESETGATTDSRKGKDARRGRDEDMTEEEEGEMPAATDDEDNEEKESDVPPTQHETTPSEASGEEEWEADHPKEGEDETFESAPEESLKEGEIPKNPLPKAGDRRAKGMDSIELALRKQREYVCNPSNFGHDKRLQNKAIDAFNLMYRAVKGKTSVKTSDRSYGDLANPKKPENLRSITDGKSVNSEQQINDSMKEMHTAYGAFLRGEGPDPTKKKKSA